MLIKHLLVYSTHELILFVEIFPNLRDLLTQLIRHHCDNLFIELALLSGSCGLSFVNFLRERRLIVDDTDTAAHRSGLLLLFTVDLHYVVYDVKVVIDCVSTCQDVLSNLVWLRLLRVRITISSGRLNAFRRANCT